MTIFEIIYKEPYEYPDSLGLYLTREVAEKYLKELQDLEKEIWMKECYVIKEREVIEQ